MVDSRIACATAVFFAATIVLLYLRESVNRHRAATSTPLNQQIHAECEMCHDLEIQVLNFSNLIRKECIISGFGQREASNFFPPDALPINLILFNQWKDAANVLNGEGSLDLEERMVVTTSFVRLSIQLSKIARAHRKMEDSYCFLYQSGLFLHAHQNATRRSSTHTYPSSSTTTIPISSSFRLLTLDWVYEIGLTFWRMDLVADAQRVTHAVVCKRMVMHASTEESRTMARLVVLADSMSRNRTNSSSSSSSRPFVPETFCRCHGSMAHMMASSGQLASVEQLHHRLIQQRQQELNRSTTTASSRRPIRQLDRIDYVVGVHNTAFFDNTGWPTVAQNLADLFNATFIGVRIEDLLENQDAVSAATIDLLSRPNVLVVLITAFVDVLSLDHFAKIRHPTSSLLMCFGGDTLYSLKRSGKLCENSDCERHCDMWFDLVDGMVQRARGRGMRAEPWVWTPSEALFTSVESRLVQRIPSSDRKTPRWYPAHSAPRIVDPAPQVVMLFNVKSDYRQALLRAVNPQQEPAAPPPPPPPLYSLVYRQSTFIPDVEVFNIYANSAITISTTSPAPYFARDKCRSMKGFRDWIAPSLGVLLVTDDHPDTVRKYPPEVSFYPYGDFQYLARLLNSISWQTKALTQQRQNQHPFQSVLKKQRDWVRVNTLDNQLRYHLLVDFGLQPGYHASMDEGPFSAWDPTEAGWILPDQPHREECIV